VWGQGLWFPLQCPQLRRLQGLLPAQCGPWWGWALRLPGEWHLPDGCLHEAQVPAVPAPKVQGGGDERAV
jgi:hypothetical protein